MALVTGGDSGIGRAVAIAFAREGANVAIVYLKEGEDAEETARLVKQERRRCLTIAGDVANESFCNQAVEQTVKQFGRLDVLVNNAAEQHVTEEIEKITEEQLRSTFQTNIFSMFFLTKAALKHIPSGGAIINTTSVTAFKGSPKLIDYSSTKGAIVAFTRSLAKDLASRKIRVNAVAPGPIWTPLIVSTFDQKKISEFGKNTLFGRAGQPNEVAPCFVFLACDDSSFMTGEILHPNGGQVME